MCNYYCYYYVPLLIPNPRLRTNHKLGFGGISQYSAVRANPFTPPPNPFRVSSSSSSFSGGSGGGGGGGGGGGSGGGFIGNGFLPKHYGDVLEQSRKEATLQHGKKCGETSTGEDLVGVDDVNGIDYKVQEEEESMRPGRGGVELKTGKQLIKRSNIIAKQVISITTALALGFVSQLWVDTSHWAVVLVELRQNLLSTDSVKVLLQDIKQVGDVVLVQDESVLVDEFRMVGLETLVGYEVVTPGRRSIGKVRGYTFNIYSGVLESLELDSFGFSIIPSSLVSTYALFVEDVIEVVSDTVIVHEAAASRIQRVTKGIWGRHRLGRHVVDIKYYDVDEEPLPRQDESEDHDARRSFRRRRSRPGARDVLDDWEPPMDYL